MPLQANVLYSGADDCTFKGWDIRCPTAVSTTSSTAAAVQHPPSSTASTTSLEVQDDLEPSTAAQQTALFSNRKAHGAGVCCISSHPRRQHTLVTGSYDESIRLWDVRMWARPVETCQVGHWYCLRMIATCHTDYLTSFKSVALQLVCLWQVHYRRACLCPSVLGK
jgi:WD40 repeat protein